MANKWTRVVFSLTGSIENLKKGDLTDLLSTAFEGNITEFVGGNWSKTRLE